MQKYYGNYIGENIEAVILRKYTLLFINDKTKGVVESYLADTDGFVCRAACISPSNAWIEKGQHEKVCFFRNIGGESLSSGGEIAKLDGVKLFNISADGDKSTFNLFDGRVFFALRQERYSNGNLSPNPVKAHSGNISRCLQEWHLGVQEQTDGKTLYGLEFNSLKHMYIFYISNDFIYCRAARYTACDKGIVFSQNFRQNFHALEGQSFAVTDNQIALSYIDYDEDLFKSDECVFSQYDIYWSVSKVEDDVIYLNGCGGEAYFWRRPE